MNTQERALEKAKSKVEELMWATPEGLTISEITGDLRISVALAKTALKAIGAVYEGGVWVLHDDDVAPVAAPAIVNTDTSPAPDKTTSEPVAKQEMTVPVSESNQADSAPAETCQDTCTAHICSVDDACFIASRDAAEPIKSDYAIAMDIEREKVLNVIQSGATLARVAEITGLHIDDAQHHVDVLIDLGKVVARPVVVATAYEVVA